MAKITEVAANKRLYTPKQFCDLFDISRTTFSDWRRRKLFDVVSIPGRRRIYVKAESVQKLLQDA